MKIYGQKRFGSGNGKFCAGDNDVNKKIERQKGIKEIKMTTEERLAEKERENIWDDITDFTKVLKKSLMKEWHWWMSKNCKYVNLRVDMRNGGCIISDSSGKRIDPEDLEFQYQPSPNKAIELTETVEKIL